MKNTMLSFLMLFCLGFVEAGTLNGTYTINASGTGYKNYTTFKKAVQALSDSGISGPVVFNISDGTYKEKITINAIKGSSATNTVTFQSSSLDSSKVILDSVSNGTFYSPGYTIGFNACSYITIRKITVSNIVNSQTNYFGHVIYMIHGASHINIENCRLLSNYGSTITNYSAVIKDADTSNELYIGIRNNYIHGGYFGIQLNSNSGNGETGNSIVNNNVTAFFNLGMLIEMQDSILIERNTIYSTAQYCAGIAIDETQDAGQDTSRIINNFITLPNGSYGLYLYDNNSIDVCNNSVHVSFTGSVTAYFQVGNSSSNIRVFNNIFSNDSDGYAINVATGAVSAMDYNNFYSHGSNFGYHDATTFSKISLWRNATGMDNNSVLGKPYFKSVSKGDLHLTNKSLNDIHRGKSLPSVVDDIDGQARSGLPSIGADDVPLKGNDAMLYSIDSPVLGFCSGTKAIYVRFGNVGNATITSATINWGINGVARSPVNWKGSLKSGNYILIKLDTVTFAAGNLLNIYAASHNPNGIVDSFPANDSTNVLIAASMSGTFTIGGTSPDFKTIRAATNVLNKAGVCGPVVFNIRDGKYKETIYLTGIRGASEVNTITFQSQSLDSSKVSIDTSWGSVYPTYCLTLDAASHFIFNKLGLGYHADNSGITVNLINNSNRNIFSNNLITGINSTYDFGVYIQDGNNNLIENNYITKSLYGLYMISLNSIPWGNIIRGNTFYSPSYAIFSQNSDSLVIRNNKIINSLFDGIYLTLDSTLLLRDTFLIDNNFIYSEGECIYMQARKAAIRFNTLYSNSNYLAMEFHNISTAATSDLLNNIIVNDNGGSALYVNGPNIYSDYNDLVVNAGKYYLAMSSISGNSYDLKSWRKSSGMDMHSVSVDPGFLNKYSGDLHIKSLSSGVARKGSFLLNYYFDIDHQRRPHNACDIGADQFSFESNDIGVTGILYPGSKRCEDSINSVPVQVSNLGLKPETGFKVYLSVKGPDTVTASYTFSNTLKPGRDTVVLMPLPHKLNTSGNGYYYFTANTSLVNDTDRTSDTLMARYSFRDGLIVNLNFRSPSCAGDITFLYDSSKGNPKSSQWNFGDGFSSSKINPLHVFVRPGKYTVSLKIRDALGCTDSGVKIITVDSADARYSYAINKLRVDFTSNISGLKNYRWDYGDGSPIDTTASPSHFFSAKGKYRVILRVINKGGCMATYSDSVNLLLSETNEEMKDVFNFSVYPNPFSDVTNIAYSIDKTTHMDIEVYDVWGRRLTTLLDNEQASGAYTIRFNPLDYNIRAAGMLVLKINAGNYTARKTMILTH